MTTLRAGSVLGISLRAQLEFRATTRTKNRWKKGFFTFNEITCSMFLHSAPGKDPMDVYEISSCIEKPNRMFKRKNRMDVLCTDGELLSLSAPTKELKVQFMDKFSESCTPTNSAATRQLRSDMASESRKVIALTSLHDRLQQKYDALLLQNGEALNAEKSTATKLAMEKFVNLLLTRSQSSVSRAFLRLKSNAMEKNSALTQRKNRSMSSIVTAIKSWQVRTKSHFFIKWVRYCIVDDVKDKISTYERAQTLAVAKRQLRSSVAVVLDIVSEARRQEIELMEAELNALDTAGGGRGGVGEKTMNERIEELVKESYEKAMEKVEGLEIPHSPAKQINKSFGEGVINSPDIHIFSDDEGDSINNGNNNNNGGGPEDDLNPRDLSFVPDKKLGYYKKGDEPSDDETEEVEANLSFVPDQISKIEKRLSLTSALNFFPTPTKEEGL
ncbi:hypothetical protein TL16_g11058 [Triparma laevis f. inornata]|uniref:Uncharacterized protein n=1 Tax=Triparma laevis f. inornata TaxID=1714386 RepID=A0A9W7BK27_9STRA|nr:hypothetical protein TL16_g11058 [Triparma laevis f. inornata]